jgi:Fe2+/Zn2+ uptake regulation proteins
MDRDSIIQTLKQHNISGSYHRIRIYQYMLEQRNHPSADMIFQALALEIPSLSKATVYNTLNLLAAKGLVRSLGVIENEAHFDADTTLHGHFLCNVCGDIQDVYCHDSLIHLFGLEKSAVDEIQIYFKGQCASCRAGGQPMRHGDDGQEPEREKPP